MIDLYGVDAALERLRVFVPDTAEANQAYVKVEAELDYVEMWHDCTSECAEEHVEDSDIRDGSRAFDLVRHWTTRLRMGYDLGMSKLEMLDELERVLK